MLNEGLGSELRGQRHMFWFLSSSVVQGLCVSSRPPQAVERRLQADLGLSAAFVVRPVMGSSRSSRRELVHGFSDRPRAGAAVHAGGVNFGVMHGYPLTAWYAAGGQRDHSHRSDVLAQRQGLPSSNNTSCT